MEATWKNVQLYVGSFFVILNLQQAFLFHKESYTVT